MDHLRPRDIVRNRTAHVVATQNMLVDQRDKIIWTIISSSKRLNKKTEIMDQRDDVGLDSNGQANRLTVVTSGACFTQETETVRGV